MTRRARLVLGLGGALAGDDAIGLHLARALARETGLPPDVDVLAGGADLLRMGDALTGRSHVVLLDAILARAGESEPLVADHPIPGLSPRQEHAHQLSAPQALDLLRMTEPALAATRFTWFLVPVTEVRPGTGISPALAARIPALTAALTTLLH